MKRTKKEALETRANILESALDILSVKKFREYLGYGDIKSRGPHQGGVLLAFPE